METTRLSSKGQIVIPMAIRTAHGWESGAEFVVEDAGDAVVLRPVRPFPGTEVREVLGCTGYMGPRKSLKEMEDAIAEGARRGR